MPLVDHRTSSVVLRIVYDGPPEAGKMTNLRQLCERLSLSPRGAPDGAAGHDRTRFFDWLDWLDVTGGAIGGRRVRCQLVSLPGQIQLARRRRHILDSADVVVVVADSRPRAAPETNAALRSLARGLGHRADVPLVLQANKQDLPDAQPPALLHAALGLAARVPVVAAEASGGSGVVETFMLAVRLAVDHVRALLVAGELGEADSAGTGELLRALEADAPEAFDALDAIARAADARAAGTTAGPNAQPLVPAAGPGHATAAELAAPSPPATPPPSAGAELAAPPPRDVPAADTAALPPRDAAELDATPVLSAMANRDTTRPIRTARLSRSDITAAATAAVLAASSEPTEPTEPTEPGEPTEPAEPTEPTNAPAGEAATQPVRVIRCAPVRRAASATLLRAGISTAASARRLGDAIVRAGDAAPRPITDEPTRPIRVIRCAPVRITTAAALPEPSPRSPAAPPPHAGVLAPIIALGSAPVRGAAAHPAPAAHRAAAHPAPASRPAPSALAPFIALGTAPFAAALDAAFGVPPPRSPGAAQDATASGAPARDAAASSIATPGAPAPDATEPSAIAPDATAANAPAGRDPAPLVSEPAAAPIASVDAVPRDAAAPAVRDPAPVVSESGAARNASNASVALDGAMRSRRNTLPPAIAPGSPRVAAGATASSGLRMPLVPATDLALLALGSAPISGGSAALRDGDAVAPPAPPPAAQIGGLVPVGAPIIELAAELVAIEPMLAAPSRAARWTASGPSIAELLGIEAVTAEVTIPEATPGDEVTVEIVPVDAITLECAPIEPAGATDSSTAGTAAAAAAPGSPGSAPLVSSTARPAKVSPAPLTSWSIISGHAARFLGTDEDTTWDLPAVDPPPPVAAYRAATASDALPTDAWHATAAPHIADAHRPADAHHRVEPQPTDAMHAAWALQITEADAAAAPGEVIAADDRCERTAAPAASPALQPPPVDLPAGMVWPGISGRASLAALGVRAHLVERLATWAPAEGIELACGEGWSAHTSDALVFSELDHGRAALLDAARWQTKMGSLTPPGRTYALAPEGDRARLWVLTPTCRTVWRAIEQAFAHGDRAMASRLARLGLEAVDEIRARGAAITDLDHVAIDDPPRLLATPWTPRGDRLIVQLQRLFAAAVL